MPSSVNLSTILIPLPFKYIHACMYVRQLVPVHSLTQDVLLSRRQPLESSTPPCVYVRWSSLSSSCLRRARRFQRERTPLFSSSAPYTSTDRMVEASGWGPWQRYDDGRSLPRILLSLSSSLTRAPTLSHSESAVLSQAQSIAGGCMYCRPTPRYAVIPYRSSIGLDVHFSWVTSVPSRMLSHTLPPYSSLSLCRSLTIRTTFPDLRMLYESVLDCGNRDRHTRFC